MTMLKFWSVCLCLILLQSVYAEESDHEGSAIELSAEEQRAAGIVVGTVEPRALNETLRIPGRGRDQRVSVCARYPAHYRTSRSASCETRR